MSETRREVRVGDDHYVLRPFRGFKALEILARVTALMDAAPGLQDEVRVSFRKHRDQNLLEIPRNVFEMRYPEDAKSISEKGWAEAGQVIRLPDPDAVPLDGMEVFIQILPKILKLARNEVIDILALVVVKDSDLRDADENDSIDELLNRTGRKLLYDGTLEQLAELGIEAFGLVQEQFSGKVAELLSQVTGLLTGVEADQEEPETPEEATMEEDLNETSSTSSQGSTDGPERKLSGTDGMTSPLSQSESVVI